MPRSRQRRRPDAAVRAVNVLPWRRFQDVFSRAHKQGEHVAVVGPTGSGKSVAALELCRLAGARLAKDGRPNRVVVIATKKRDETLSRFIAETDFKPIKEWPPPYGSEHAVVWPKGGPASGKAARQAMVIGPLLDTIYDEGGQTVCIDEAAYFERPLPKGLGLGSTMEQFWSEARSGRITLIGGTQRPRNVTRLMWSEPSWILIFSVEDIDDLKRVAELSGRKQDVLEIVPRLGGHEFLAIRRQRGGGKGLYVSRVDRMRKVR